MTTKAYVLIKVQPGNTRQVLKTLYQLQEVKQAHPCFGQPDIFCFAQVDNEQVLSEFVVSKIHSIPGVEETDTHIVAEP